MDGFKQITVRPKIHYEEFFQAWADFVDVSKDAKKVYLSAVSVFLSYCYHKGITRITLDDFVKWKKFLIESGKKPSTVNMYLTVAKRFFRFLQFRGFQVPDVQHVKPLRVSNYHGKDALTIDQAKKLLEYFEETSPLQIRNKVIASLMLTCGLRCVEIVRANINDIVRMDDRLAFYVQGKGRLDRTECVMIPDKVADLLERYLKVRTYIRWHLPPKDEEALFISKKGRIVSHSVSRIIRLALRELGIKTPRITTHSLRHTAATQMLKNGVDLLQVQQILRHKNVNTTLIYAHHLERLKNHGEDTVADSLL